MRTGVLLAGLLMTAVAWSAPAYAQSQWTYGFSYGAQVTGKLLYGLKNTLLGWTELFTEPKQALDYGEGAGAGFARGLGHAVWTTAGGAVHLLTFPITAIDVPLPHDGVFSAY